MDGIEPCVFLSTRLERRRSDKVEVVCFERPSLGQSVLLLLADLDGAAVSHEDKLVIIRPDRETHIEVSDAVWLHVQPVGGRGDDLSFDLRSLYPSAGLHIEDEKALVDDLRRVERRVP